MANVMLFHHAHGLTGGLCAFADRLRADGHTVYTPDTYSGRVFTNLDEGIGFAETIGRDAIAHVGMRSARKHRDADVTIGFSMGTMQAQLVAQHVRRMRGCLLMGGVSAPDNLGSSWRPNVALQIHVAEPDDWCTSDEVESLHRAAPAADVFTYADQAHMFVDPSLPDYDADAADLFEERALAWLAAL
ncbi:dienelactone hydrolase family protein [Demequina flava]|uniref:dienelactone hydrolase family protein n=1 Tax=Demequina flava TaxID=1095025 RepID=UPI0007806102|nr:dienelactone hydrolase family protein [Demequina flava]